PRSVDVSWNQYVCPAVARKPTWLLPRAFLSHPTSRSDASSLPSYTPSAVGFAVPNVLENNPPPSSAVYRYQAVPPVGKQSPGSPVSRVAFAESVCARNGMLGTT